MFVAPLSLFNWLNKACCTGLRWVIKTMGQPETRHVKGLQATGRNEPSKHMAVSENVVYHGIPPNQIAIYYGNECVK